MKLIHPIEKHWLSYDEREGFTDGLWDLHDGKKFVTTNKYNILIAEDLP